MEIKLTTLSNPSVDILQHENMEFCIDEICTVLARLPRFGGQTALDYTVAAHSYCCAEIARALDLSPEIQMCCLLHDMAECYIGDIVKPFKDNIMIKIDESGAVIPISMFEERMYKSLKLSYCKHFKKALSFPDPQIVRDIDYASGLAEMVLNTDEESIDVESPTYLRMGKIQMYAYAYSTTKALLSRINANQGDNDDIEELMRNRFTDINLQIPTVKN
jgi:5'-deoxynucleotidase YfbR-like HD superfamily hydrolase